MDAIKTLDDIFSQLAVRKHLLNLQSGINIIKIDNRTYDLIFLLTVLFENCRVVWMWIWCPVNSTLLITHCLSSLYINACFLSLHFIQPSEQWLTLMISKQKESGTCFTSNCLTQHFELSTNHIENKWYTCMCQI